MAGSAVLVTARYGSYEGYTDCETCPKLEQRRNQDSCGCGDAHSATRVRNCQVSAASGEHLLFLFMRSI